MVASRRFKHQRGVTLLEGMMASLVLLLGLVGVLQGVIFASRQNATANKIVRAGAIATRIRAALMVQGPAIFNANAVTSTNCTSANFSNAAIQPYLDGFTATSGNGTTSYFCSPSSGCKTVTQTYTTCVMNLGVFEESATAANMIAGARRGAPDDKDLFRVFLIRFNDSSGVTQGANIVVTWLEAGTPRSHVQHVVFNNPSSYSGVRL